VSGLKKDENAAPCDSGSDTIGLCKQAKPDDVQSPNTVIVAGYEDFTNYPMNMSTHPCDRSTGVEKPSFSHTGTQTTHQKWIWIPHFSSAKESWRR
jgi:hypothetical protein